MTVLRSSEAFSQYGRAAVRHAVESGRWQRPRRGVYVTHNGPLARDEVWQVELAACPSGSAIAGLTALELDGFSGFETGRCHLLIPEGADRPRLPGTAVHWSTRLDATEIHPLREPRRTRPARSVSDAAAWASSDRHARAIVLAALQQGLVNERLMHEVVDRRGTVRRAGLVRESVLDASGGIQSLPEKDFDDILLLANLPRPTRQQVRRGKDGRYYLDAAWLEYDVAAEIHGLPHLGVVQWSNDLLRANEVVIDGPRLLIFTSYVVRHEPVVLLDQLVRALRAGGWQGQPRPVSILSRRQRRATYPRRDAV